MKIGTHNLGHNTFSQMTIAKLEAGALIIRQSSPGLKGGDAFAREITLSANQIALLKDVLS